MTSIFVERRLELASDGDVTVQFFKPELNDSDYRCDYCIRWPDRERRFHGFGVDAV